MKLEPRAFGVTLGLIWGGILFTVTMCATPIGRGGTLQKLSLIYPGYYIGFGGAVIGFIYAFISAFIAGYLFAIIYNKLSKK